MKTLLEGLLDVVFGARAQTYKPEEILSLARAQKTHAGVHYLFSYKDALIRSAIADMKYRRNKAMLLLFSEAVALHITETCAEELIGALSDVVLVPIPRSPKNKRDYGIDQSIALLREIKKRIPEVTIEEPLIRRKTPPPQTNMTSRSARVENATKLFSLKKDVDGISDKVVFLIDDVTTTGASMKSAKQLLREQRPARVFQLALAH